MQQPPLALAGLRIVFEGGFSTTGPNQGLKAAAGILSGFSMNGCGYKPCVAHNREYTIIPIV